MSFEARFARRDCTPCALRPRCTRAKCEPRIIGLQEREHFEALQGARKHQETEAFRASYAARAGIEFPPGQVCGMHSLRGALAVAMIGDGTPMPVVSAVLGHASSDTTQAYYLRFDVERLRCCALDVEDVIEPAGAGERHA